jgi:group I intron endonuclease
MSNLNCSGIYAIRHITDGKIYVGQSNNIRLRIYRHKCHNNPTHIGRAIALYGWDTFEVLLLERVDNTTLLNEREQYWINTLNASDPAHGYNILPTAGSPRGWKHSNESKEKIRAAVAGIKRSEETRARLRIAQAQRSPESYAKSGLKRKGKSASPETEFKPGHGASKEVREKLRIANTGKKLSQDTIEKIRAANLGQHRSDEMRAKMSGRPCSDEKRAKISKSNIERHTTAGGIRSYSKLNPEQVIEIREKYASSHISKTALAKEYHVSHTTISEIIARKSWRYV